MEDRIMTGKQRAFIIDDHSDSSESLKMFLELDGFAVATFSDCAAALRHVISDHPCVIFLDLQMPQGALSTSDFVRRVRASSQDAVIVVLSARSDCDKVADALKADGWLRKPYDPAQISAIASQHCPRSK
jgi:DNA-binding response OmpR family regulator